MEEKIYDNHTLEVMELFPQVWSRVAGTTPLPPPKNTLPDLLAALHRLSALYAALTRFCRDMDITTAQRMAAETGRHFRRLQAEYYIRTGTLRAQDKEKITTSKKLPLLRETLLLEHRLCGLCKEMPEPLFDGLAMASQERQEAVKRLLIACF